MPKPSLLSQLSIDQSFKDELGLLLVDNTKERSSVTLSHCSVLFNSVIPVTDVLPMLTRDLHEHSDFIVYNFRKKLPKMQFLFSILPLLFIIVIIYTHIFTMYCWFFNFSIFRTISFTKLVYLFPFFHYSIIISNIRFVFEFHCILSMIIIFI